MYQDLSTCHDWPIKKVNVELAIKMNSNLRHTSGYLLNSLGTQNKGSWVKILRLRGRLLNTKNQKLAVKLEGAFC